MKAKPRRSTRTEDLSWKRVLAQAYTRPEDLLRALDLPIPSDPIPDSLRSFPCLVTRSYAACIRPGDPEDPLLLQVLPTVAEWEVKAGYGPDPVGDQGAIRAPGLLKKYPGRALLVLTGACAIHCRYCFRRHFPYGEGALIHDPGLSALGAIASDTRLSEVILSGGDPLLYEDGPLGALLERLAGIPHLRRVRIHTRVPTVLPERITPEFLRLFEENRLQTLMVIQVNHPRELNEGARRALGSLVRAGIPVFNQSVLLRRVNDRLETLTALSDALFEIGVIPYYLHRLDPVAGAAHFEVPGARIQALIRGLRTSLPGYLVPRLVQERPGLDYKQPIGVD